jgi:tyrosyl-tRNA synthetase
MILKQTLEFEVYPNNIVGEYTWDEAVDACKKLGDGWRLPTQEELHLMWRNNENIGNFVADYYWSSSESNTENALIQDLSDGDLVDCCKWEHLPVRPVRDIKQELIQGGRRMTVKEIIDKERWEVCGAEAWHNEALDRIEQAVNTRLTELETALEDIAGYATIETPQEVIDIINKTIGGAK